MFVKVSAEGGVTLEDRHNFRAFKLVVERPRTAFDEVCRALNGTAELADHDTAWISEAALRARAEEAEDQIWQQALRAMIEKARPHGWIDDARKAIKAHIEWAA